jgi:Holliday junction resolvase
VPNRNRDRGDYFERRTRDALEADGWVVVRAAGSFGPADLMALRAEHRPWLVSCKLNGYLTRLEVIALCDAAEKAGALAILAWRKRAGIVHLALVTKHGKTSMEPMRMPPRPRKPKGTSTPVDPDQLTIYDVLEDG